METTARNYRTIQAEIRALEAKAGALKEKMIAELEARQIDKLAAGEYVITWVTFESSRLDSAKLKADHADLYAIYQKPSIATRFQVT